MTTSGKREVFMLNFRIAVVVATSVVTLGCGDRNPAAPSSLSLSQGTDEASVATNASEGTRLGTRGADDIRVVQGLAQTGDRTSPGTIQLKGTHGFSLDGRLSTSGQWPGLDCIQGPDVVLCAPGTSHVLSAAWVDTDAGGTVRLKGQEFPVGTGAAMGCSLLMMLETTPFVFPPEAATATLTVPFELRGQLGCPGFRYSLAGNGTATIELRWFAVGDTWEYAAVTYDFGNRPQ